MAHRRAPPACPGLTGQSPWQPLATRQLRLSSPLGWVCVAVIASILSPKVDAYSSTDPLSESDGLLAGHERMKELAHDYEVVHIDTRQHSQHVRERRSLAAGASSYSHPPRAEFKVQVFGKQYTLDLRLNSVLIPKNFQLQTFDENNNMVTESNVEHCYYQGKVDGFGAGNSSVVLSTCNGLAGSFAVGPAGDRASDETFFIQPLLSEPAADGRHPHAVYKARDAKWGPAGTCGHTSSSNSTTGGAAHSVDQQISSLLRRKTSHSRVRRQSPADQVTKYTEIMLVGDNALVRRFNGNSAVLQARMLEIANYLDAVYRLLHVRIALVAVQLFTNGDRFNTSMNVHEMLSRFNAYRRAQINPTIAQDNVQLVTGLDFHTNVVGLATVSAICYQTTSAGVNQDNMGPYERVASTIAHEMGHNFGMFHDIAGCWCPVPTAEGGCIMWPSSNPITPRAWTNCSASYLNALLNEGKGHCLFNEPSQLFGDPVCGNGFVEDGEDCECFDSDCSCCDAATCRLSAGSQCVDGECCENCRYRAAGTLCRDIVNSCDVVETCSGTTRTCPSDLFVQNGQSCGSGASASYCWNGACNTHTAQCKKTFGAGANEGPQKCYNYNTAGNKGGNCNIDSNEKFVGCAGADVRCGRLHCIGGELFSILSGRSETNKLMFGNDPVCKSTTFLGPENNAEVSYVDEGTPCGAGSLCLGRRCRLLNEVTSTTCPATNGQVCSGNGVCSNLDTCACQHGWTTADCSVVATGPIDGKWSPWTTWSACTQTCGKNGVRSRTRECDNPYPSDGGAECDSADSSREACNSIVCPQPVDGMWSPWSDWTDCSKTCGGGQRQRLHSCTSPPPSGGGAACTGATTQSEVCGQQACPSWQTWMPWGQFTACTATCGGGDRLRVRTCPVSGQCPGSAMDQQTCGTLVCDMSVNGQWAHWTAWRNFGDCSVCRQGDYQVRSRTCTRPPPVGDGKTCPGSFEEREPCASCKETDTDTRSTVSPATRGLSDGGIAGLVVGLLVLSAVAMFVFVHVRGGDVLPDQIQQYVRRTGSRTTKHSGVDRIESQPLGQYVTAGGGDDADAPLRNTSSNSKQAGKGKTRLPAPLTLQNHSSLQEDTSLSHSLEDDGVQCSPAPSPTSPNHPSPAAPALKKQVYSLDAELHPGGASASSTCAEHPTTGHEMDDTTGTDVVYTNGPTAGAVTDDYGAYSNVDV